MKDADAASKIIGFMTGEGRPLSFKELVRSFDVPRDERDSFKSIIRGLVADGALVKIRGGRYGLPSRMNLVTGTLTCHPDGYGFVEPEEGGEDVFIGPRKHFGAMHGDTVIARVEGFKSGGRREGRIIRVLKRARNTIVGRFETSRGFAFVIPSEQRILDRVIIPPDSIGGATDGMIVEAEITRWPSKGAAPAGRVIEVMGDPDDVDVEADVILKKYGLPSRFPAPVMQEIAGVRMEVGEDEIRGRVDLRGMLTVTIDGETARDFDDAVSVERTEKGYILRVSIADVSHYVHENTALDAEAYARATSVYFPDRCVPMLPEALSNGICSLNPQVDRLTLTAELELDASGRVTGKRFYESVIRSAERMTYTNVKTLIHGGDAELEKRYAVVTADLKLMAELAEKIRERRFEEGSIDFDLPEPQIILDIEGRIEDIVRSERNVAHRLIEEFMLSANRAVAGEFFKRELPFIYRVHEEPDAESLVEFSEFVSAFGIHFRPSTRPKALQGVLKAVEGRPEERLVNHVLLRSMKQAVYSEVNAGHFGLAFEDYTHFTSPIRRYPDLIVHRILKAFIHGRYTHALRDRMEEYLPGAASHTSARERKAMEAEREIADLKKAQFMRDKVGSSYDGFVSGVTSFGVFIELKDYFVEGLVHISSLLDDYYIFDEKRHTLTGERTKRRFRPGDPVRVVIAAVDLERKRIEMLLEEPGRRGAARPPVAAAGKRAEKGKGTAGAGPGKEKHAARKGRAGRGAAKEAGAGRKGQKRGGGRRGRR